VAHVEFVRHPERVMAYRMLEYRARIMRREPGCALTQHVVVLAGGRVPAVVRDGGEFAMRLRVTYLREHDPAEFLGDAALAPLAVLGRSSSPQGHAGALRRALGVLESVADPVRRAKLVEVANVLAAIHLDADTIERAGREAGMPITLEGTKGGRDLERRARTKGRAEGHAEMLTAMLAERFGSDPRIAAAVERLAALPHAAAVRHAMSADTLDRLVSGEALGD
jgi:hypothetical protein